MFKKLLNKKLVKNEKGLTLIELLAVIVILAIVAAIAIPSIGNIINKSKDRAILAEASNILAGAKIAYVDGACVDDVCSNKELQPFVDGITLTDKTKVSIDDKGKWKIEYSRFEELKLKEYEIKGEITEEDLNEKLLKAGGDSKTDAPTDGNEG